MFECTFAVSSTKHKVKVEVINVSCIDFSLVKNKKMNQSTHII